MTDTIVRGGVAATGYDKRFSEIETKLAVISAELTLHRWVFLAMTGMQVAILIRLLLK